MIHKIRDEFSALQQKVNGKPLVYLDTAATALKPRVVVEALMNFYKFETANVHRGAHFLADRATGKFEATREVIKNFIGAKSVNEVLFTKGTTEGLNLIAQSLARNKLEEGDEILLTEMEHHSNIVPWQLVGESTGAVIKFVNITDTGELDFDDFKKKLSERTKIFSVTHCSNALGTVNPLTKFIQEAKRAGVIVVVDAAQSITFSPIDVTQLGCDFLVFSGHKLYGPYGVGVLYGKEELLNAMPPYQGGGAMIADVTKEKTTFLKAPQRFEAGTPNISGVIGLGEAVRFVQSVGLGDIREHEEELLHFALNTLQEFKGLKFIGQSKSRVNLFSLLLENMHPLDVGQILDQQGVAVRVGHHCAQPLMKRYGIAGTLRVSLGVYNNTEDIVALINGLKKAQELLK